jgi:hypothetical protein
MNLKRVKEAFSLLKKFESSMKSMNDKNGLIWYHALSMDLLLDSSFTLESYKNCYEFYKNEISLFSVANTEEKSRFFANLWLWSVRHKIHEMSEMWMNLAITSFSFDPNHSIENTFTGLRIIEALTLQMVISIDDNDMRLVENYKHQMIKFKKSMKLPIKTTKCFQNHFEFQEIHLQLATNQQENFSKVLDKLASKALKNQKFHLYDLIKHNQRHWKCDLTPAMRNFWINHSNDDNELTLSHLNNQTSDRIFPFSLRIPNQKEIKFK